MSAVLDTGAPGSPLPADDGSREAVGAARQRLAAAAGVRTGWSGNFFLMNLWGHWERRQQVRPPSEGPKEKKIILLLFYKKQIFWESG